MSDMFPQGPPRSDEKKQDEKKKPVEPKKPVSTRRNLTDNLGGRKLQGGVQKIIREKTTITAQNIKHMLDDPTVAQGLNLTGDKEASVVLAEAAARALAKNRKRKAKITSLQSAPLTTQSEIVQKEAVPQIRQHMDIEKDTTAYYKPFGQQKGQMFAEQGSVLALGPDLKIGGQVLQLLGHYSQLFMEKARDLEYECMLVNERLLVAANAKANIQQFRGGFLKDLLQHAESLVVTDADSTTVRAQRIVAVAKALTLDAGSTAALTALETEGAKVLAEYAVGHHVDYDSRKALRTLLTILGEHAQTQVQLLGPFTPEKAAEKITANDARHAIILVEPKVKKGWHAEQSLVLAMVNAGWTGGAAVSGTKNPCFFCFHTLSLANQCGYPLEFNITPGLSWTDNTLKGVVGVAQALGITSTADLLRKFNATEYLTENQRIQYLTSLDAAMAGREDEVDLTGRPKETDLAERLLTQDRSQKSFTFKQYGESSALIGDFTGRGPAKESRGDYGTPPSSPMANADDEAMMEYEDSMEKYRKELAEFEAAQKREGGQQGPEQKT